MFSRIKRSTGAAAMFYLINRYQIRFANWNFKHHVSAAFLWKKKKKRTCFHPRDNKTGKYSFLAKEYIIPKANLDEYLGDIQEIMSFCTFYSPFSFFLNKKDNRLIPRGMLGSGFSMKRCDNEIDNRSFGKWRVGFGVSTSQLEQQQLVARGNFQANEFPLSTLFHTYPG